MTEAAIGRCALGIFPRIFGSTPLCSILKTYWRHTIGAALKSIVMPMWRIPTRSCPAARLSEPVAIDGIGAGRSRCCGNDSPRSDPHSGGPGGAYGGKSSAGFAQAAPIQVTYLGYPDTTGLATMDYRITDNYADPVGMTEGNYREKLVRLPETFFALPARRSQAREFPRPLARSTGRHHLRHVSIISRK